MMVDSSEGNNNKNDSLSPRANHDSKDPVENDSVMERMLASCKPALVLDMNNNNNVNSLDSFIESMLSNNEDSGLAVNDYVAKFFDNQLSRDFSQLKWLTSPC